MTSFPVGLPDKEGEGTRHDFLDEMIAECLRTILVEVIDEWELAEGALDQEFLAGRREFEEATQKRARQRADWIRRFDAFLPEGSSSE